MAQGFDKTKPEYKVGLSSDMLRVQFNALCSHHEGPTEPVDLQRGLFWLDTSDSENWRIKMRIDSDWVTLFCNVNAIPVALAASEIHDQTEPADQWVVSHNRGSRVMPVVVLNDSFQTINPATYSIEYVDENQFNINFSGSTSGKVYIF